MAESNSDEKKPAANKGDNDVKVVMFADTKKRLRKCGKFVRQHIHLIRTFSVLFAVSLCSGLIRNSYTFTGYVPKHRCIIPYCDYPHNASYFGNLETASNFNDTPSFAEYISLGIPGEVLGRNEDRYTGLHCLTTIPEPSLESCSFYISEIRRRSSDIEVHRCTPENALFDPSVVSTSIPTDFRLVWDNSSTHSAVAHLSEVGGLLGCLIAGYLADLHGRKKIMFAAVAISSISGTLGGLVSGNLVWISLMRLVTGAGDWGTMVVAIVWSGEAAPHKQRSILVVLLWIPHLIGRVLMAVEAYHIRTWPELQLVIHAPVIFVLFGWLITIDTLSSASDTSGKPPVATEVGTLMQLGAKAKKLVSPVQVLARTGVLVGLGLALGMAHYGTVARATQHSLLPSDEQPYYRTTLMACLEIAGVLLAASALGYWREASRKLSTMLALALTGLSCLVMGVVASADLPELYVIVSVLGALASSASLALYFLYLVEAHQTEVRCSAVGFFAFSTLIGCMVGNALLDHCPHHAWQLEIAFGILAMSAAVVGIVLPETVTRHHHLPRNVDELKSVATSSTDHVQLIYRWLLRLKKQLSIKEPSPQADTSQAEEGKGVDEASAPDTKDEKRDESTECDADSLNRNDNSGVKRTDL